ncbi:MAG: hypothetical protein COV76_03130 [Candidatus Omnitrophica bacterium CG11_big_fil_rev_8_21_14_0_20_64_10]|nr:MAG: hypothetical protein COV76_03130 [Candidatus Omnitrophica bacterium CG11_big_fil_rev_8_21_14_0_20_64_10]
MRSLLFSLISFSMILTPATPAFSEVSFSAATLRQTGLESSDAGRAQIASALTASGLESDSVAALPGYLPASEPFRKGDELYMHARSSLVYTVDEDQKAIGESVWVTAPGGARFHISDASLRVYRVRRDKAAGLESAAPARPVDLARWRQTPLVGLMSVTEDRHGNEVYGNVFFHDGLWDNEDAMYQAFEGDGASSVTTNQSIISKKAPFWKGRVREYWLRGIPLADAFQLAYHSETSIPAQALAPLRGETGGVLGQVSQEASALVTELQPLVDGMRRIDELHGTTTLLTKLPSIRGEVPAAADYDEAGPQATLSRVSEGRSGNITLGFSVQRYIAHSKAHIEGLGALVARLREENATQGDIEAVLQKELASVNWVFSLFMSRVDRLLVPWFDEAIAQAEAVQDGGQAAELRMLRGKTAVALGRFTGQVMQYVYGISDQLNDEAGFLSTEEREEVDQLRKAFAEMDSSLGAKPLNLLIASSGKYPEQDYATDLQYVLPFLGPGSWNTLPPATFKALAEFARAVRNAAPGQGPGGGVTLESLQARNLVQEPLPWVEQPAGNWDDLILSNEETREDLGVESRSAGSILKRTEELLLAGRENSAEQTLAGVGVILRDQGAAGFEKAEREVVSQLGEWYAEFDQEALGWGGVIETLRQRDPKRLEITRVLPDGAQEAVTVLEVGGEIRQSVAEQIARGVLAGQQVASTAARYLLDVYPSSDGPGSSARLTVLPPLNAGLESGAVVAVAPLVSAAPALDQSARELVERVLADADLLGRLRMNGTAVVSEEPAGGERTTVVDLGQLDAPDLPGQITVYLQAELSLPAAFRNQVEIISIGRTVPDAVAAYGRRAPQPGDVVILNEDLIPDRNPLDLYTPTAPDVSVIGVTPEFLRERSTTDLIVLILSHGKLSPVPAIRSIETIEVRGQAFAVVRSA